MHPGGLAEIFSTQRVNSHARCIRYWILRWPNAARHRQGTDAATGDAARSCRM